MLSIDLWLIDKPGIVIDDAVLAILDIKCLGRRRSGPCGHLDRRLVWRDMGFTTIEVTHTGCRGAITLTRPEKLNPLSAVTLRELAAAARFLDEVSALKVVVVQGQGRAFSAGADLAAFSEGRPSHDSADTARDAADAGRIMAEAIESMRAVTVARLQGHCVGGGVVLAAACDLRIAASNTLFSIPELDLGIPLAWGGIPRLVREFGPAVTKELVMTCRPFSADEALAAGFLNGVVPEAELDDEIERFVVQLESRSRLTLSSTKQHVNAVTESMVGTVRAWNDADSLVTALRDPESRDVARLYLSRLGGEGSGPTP